MNTDITKIMAWMRQVDRSGGSSYEATKAAIDLELELPVPKLNRGEIYWQFPGLGVLTQNSRGALTFVGEDYTDRYVMIGGGFGPLPIQGCLTLDEAWAKSVALLQSRGVAGRHYLQVTNRVYAEVSTAIKAAWVDL
jgi:hypothetical protein